MHNGKIRVISFLQLKSGKNGSSVLFFGRNYLVNQHVHKNFRLTLFFSFILQGETSMLRIGIIGAGQYGRQHVEQIQGIEHVRITGVYDIQPERATALSQEFLIPQYNDIDQLLLESDALDVVCSTSAHHEMALLALRSGKHVFIEKPMCATLDQAAELVNMSLEADLKCMIGYNERFNPAFEAMRDISGPWLFIESQRVTPFTPRTSNISVVLDLMIHDIDLILKIVRSDIKQISATGVKVLSDTPDIANVRLEFNNGCVANLTASRLADREKRSLRLFQADSYYRLNLLNAELHRLSLGQNAQSQQTSKVLSEKIDIKKINTLKAQFECFVRCIEHNEPCPTSPQDAYAAMEIAFKIMKKIESLGAS